MPEYLDPKATSIQPSIPLQAAHNEVTALSLRANFSWTFVGNVIYAACQWGMLIALARLGSPEMVGRFALGLAVTAPVFMFTNLQLREIQATDARTEYAFSDYLRLRLMTTALALLIIIALVLISGYSLATGLVILGLGLAKACESFSDIFYGLLQQRERMERIAKSLIIRGTLSLVMLSIAIAVTGNLLWGIGALVCVWAGVLVGYDLRSGSLMLHRTPIPQAQAPDKHARDLPWEPQKLLRLAWLALPLGAVMMLVSLNSSIPRYFLEHYLDERALGIFAAIAYLQVAGTTVIGALGVSALPRLARYYASGERTNFRRLLLKLITLGTLLGLAGCLVALLGGREILTVIYGAAYADHVDLLLWIMLVSLFSYPVSFLGDAITATRHLKVLLVLFVVVVMVTVIGCLWLIPTLGLVGGAMVLLIAVIVRTVGSVLIVGYALHRPLATTTTEE